MLIRQKLLKHGYTDSVTDIISLLCVKYIFFWCYGSFRFEGNNKYAGKVLRQPIGMRCNFHFRYVTDKILFTLQVYFYWSLPLKFSECFSQFQIRKQLTSSFIEESSEIGRKMKSLQTKQRTCKDYVIGREITTY